MLVCGLIYAAAQGLAPLWFLQGVERIQLLAGLDIAGKALGLIGLFMFVHTPGDAWKVLIVQAIPPGLAALAGFAVMYRSVPFCRPTAPLMREALRKGWPMFLFRSGTSLYSTANVFVLGLLSSTASVGWFAGAERINTAFYGLLTPVQDAFFPRVSHLASVSVQSARRLARLGFVLITALGVLFGILTFAAAPLLVTLLMGPRYEQAVPALRILSLVLPSAAIASAVGTQWLIPLGEDRMVNLIIFSGGFLNILLACLLAPGYGHLGMAWALAVSEGLVAVAMITAALRSSGLFRASPEPAPFGVDTAASSDAANHIDAELSEEVGVQRCQ
jgi:PST family polysaccharide transporter